MKFAIVFLFVLSSNFALAAKTYNQLHSQAELQRILQWAERCPLEQSNLQQGENETSKRYQFIRISVDARESYFFEVIEAGKAPLILHLPKTALTLGGYKLEESQGLPIVGSHYEASVNMLSAMSGSTGVDVRLQVTKGVFRDKSEYSNYCNVPPLQFNSKQ